MISQIQDALGTAEEGEGLVAVARAAHQAEMELNSGIGNGFTLGDLSRAARQPDVDRALAVMAEAGGSWSPEGFLEAWRPSWDALPLLERIGLLVDWVVAAGEG